MKPEYQMLASQTGVFEDDEGAREPRPETDAVTSGNPNPAGGLTFDQIFPKAGTFGTGGSGAGYHVTPDAASDPGGFEPVTKYPGTRPTGGASSGDSSSVIGDTATAALDGAVGAVKGSITHAAMDTVMDGCFDPDSIDLDSVVGGALGSAVDGAIGSLLAVNDKTPTGEAIAKTLASKYKDEIMETLDDPNSVIGKLKALFVGISSSANVPIGLALPTGGPVVLVGGFPATRLGDKADITSALDVGPFVQGNPTVIVNGMPAAGKGHLAMGISKGTPGEPEFVASNVLMGTATVTDMSVYQKAKNEADSSSDTDSNANADVSAKGGSGAGGTAQRPLTNEEKEKVARAIDKVRNSEFGKTDEGKRVVSALDERFRTGNILHVESGARGNASYNPSTGKISLEDDDFKSDLTLGGYLTHEGTHRVDNLDFPGSAQNGTCRPNEIRAYDNEARFKDEFDEFQNDPDVQRLHNAKNREDFGNSALNAGARKTEYANDTKTRYPDVISDTPPPSPGASPNRDDEKYGKGNLGDILYQIDQDKHTMDSKRYEQYRNNSENAKREQEFEERRNRDFERYQREHPSKPDRLDSF